eukprot:CAMPEP_0172192420 /NCGR_PEP_ID=MMETSP1050-20130122/24313_1 /TAXON_ID=233186 /ORGANISM="Cryptomonas curvata, Strain CCAP979/52" /LENGTH=172 /DNA_ID=CAMNT_0012867711 /DNA_START=27 /DNA_END=545 /DNA_ORIENTATION=+
MEPVDEDDDPYLHKLKCDSIFTNLLRINHENNFLASAFVREFFETLRCDDVFNMTYHRQKYAAKINVGDQNRMFRVLNFTTSETDELIVAQAVIHYHDWQEGQLVSALRFSSRLRYYCFTRVERTFAIIGVAGAGYGGFRAALNSFRYIKHNMEIQHALHGSCCMSGSDSSQ